MARLAGSGTFWPPQLLVQVLTPALTSPELLVTPLLTSATKNVLPPSNVEAS